LRWYFPTVARRGAQTPARRINGDDELGTLFEWYGESGGQLKYYPLASSALWASEQFRLEPLRETEYGVLAKATAYFPELWAEACIDEQNDQHKF
jgi:hypothetical protein